MQINCRYLLSKKLIFFTLLCIFISILNTTPCIAEPGDIDPSFGDFGIVMTDLPGPSQEYVKDAFIIQPDGKILVTAAKSHPHFMAFALARYKPDGSLDPSFGEGGKVTTILCNKEGWSYDGYPSAIDLQADGKILVGGHARGGSAHHFALVRYNPDGSLDTIFGNNGMVFTDFDDTVWDADINDIAVQDDGRIIAAGVHSNNGDYCAIARYNPDGGLDETFGSGGKILTDSGIMSDYSNYPVPAGAHSVILLEDGKLLAAAGRNGYQFLFKYNPDGSLDETFGSAGKTYRRRPDCYSAILQPDGKIVLAGSGYNGIGLYRYNADGSIDSTFGEDGIVNTGHGSEAFSISIQDDGKLLAAGSDLGIYGPDYRRISSFAIVRLNSDGAMDATFGNNGTILTSFRTPYDDSEAHAVDVLEDGKIIAVGKAKIDRIGRLYSDTYDVAISRYNNDGSLDVTFDGDGKVTTDLGGPQYDYGYDVIAIQENGKILVGGESQSDFVLSRYTPDGVLDHTFGDGGKVRTDFRGYREDPKWEKFFHIDVIRAIAMQSDGKIVAAGGTFMNNTGAGGYMKGAFAIARYNADGKLDDTFGTDGRVVTEIGHKGYCDAIDALIQPDGKILAVGTAWSKTTGPPMEFAVVRYNPNGSLDDTFGVGGIVTTDIDPTKNDRARSIVLQTDGKIIVGGYIRDVGDFAVVRYNSDGALDLTFGVNGIVRTNLYNLYHVLLDIELQPDGKIIAAGYTAPDPSYCWRAELVRYNADGSLDDTFGIDGGVIVQFFVGNPICDCIISDLALQYNGKIVAVGHSYQFIQQGEEWLGGYDFAVARFNYDGSVDSSFGISGNIITDFGSLDDKATSATLQADGKIIVAGYAGTLVGKTPADDGYWSHYHYDIALARYEAFGAIIIDGCDTGVTDQIYDGQLISDWINDCAASAKNHGKFVSCVSKFTNKLKKAHLIFGGEKGAIMSCVGKADLP